MCLFLFSRLSFRQIACRKKYIQIKMEEDLFDVLDDPCFFSEPPVKRNKVDEKKEENERETNVDCAYRALRLMFPLWRWDDSVFEACVQSYLKKLECQSEYFFHHRFFNIFDAMISTLPSAEEQMQCVRDKKYLDFVRMNILGYVSAIEQENLIHEYDLFTRMRRGETKVIGEQTTEFRCKRCGARDGTIQIIQDRSPDEPATVHYICNKCHSTVRNMREIVKRIF